MDLNIKTALVGVGVLASIAMFVSGCAATNPHLVSTNERLDALQTQLAERQQETRSIQDQLQQMSEQQSGINDVLSELQLGVTALGGQQQSMKKALENAKVSSVPAAFAPVVEAKPSRKVTLGRVEWLWLPEQSRHFAAQLDIVSELSILFAEQIVQFEREGERWLRFMIERNDWPTMIESPVRRNEKLAFYGGSSLKGTIITLPIQLGEFSDDIEFLVVKKKAPYPQVVLGKNFLTDVALVDVAEKYLNKKDPDLMKAETGAKQAYEKQKSEPLADAEEESESVANRPQTTGIASP